jgi:hypothetical protein
VTTLVHFQGGWEEEALGLRRGLGEAGGPWEAVALKLDPEGLLSILPQTRGATLVSMDIGRATWGSP